MKRGLIHLLLLVLGLGAPLLMPEFAIQLALLWMMILFALTWDIVGGQMGYNSFGNILFFGIGCYAVVVVQRELFAGFDEYRTVAALTSLSAADYFLGFALGILGGAVLSIAAAATLGSAILGLRGHYFAICTLGIGVAAGELASGWEFIGAGSGMVAPIFPGSAEARGFFFYYAFFLLAAVCFVTVRWLYSGRFGLALNAIRDDEDKAEAMGIHTTRYKTAAWCISACFLSIAGAVFGQLNNFIDREVAFPGATFGVWMVLMAILGGKGTLWGPVIGAAVFHLTQELFWTFLFGWQRVAMGAFIVLIVVFFPQGIMGWVRQRMPERFGIRLDAADRSVRVHLRGDP